MGLYVKPGLAVDQLSSDLGGGRESFQVTVPATAGAAQADYFSFSEPDGDSYAVWLDIDAAGTAPSGAIYLAASNQIEVDISTGGSGDANAALMQSAIEASGSFNEYEISLSGAVLTFVASVPKNVTDAAPHDATDAGAGSIGVSLVQGADARYYPAMSPEALNNNP